MSALDAEAQRATEQAERLSALLARLQQVLAPALHSVDVQAAEPLERAQLHATVAHAATVAASIYFLSQGLSPAEHPALRTDMVRLRHARLRVSLACM